MLNQYLDLLSISNLNAVLLLATVFQILTYLLKKKVIIYMKIVYLADKKALPLMYDTKKVSGTCKVKIEH